MGFLRNDLASARLDDLVEAAQEDRADDSAEMTEIIRRFDGLAVSIGRQVAAEQALQNVCANTARIELVKAVRRHLIGTAGFPGYAKMSMLFAARREARSAHLWHSRYTPTDEGSADWNARRARVDMVVTITPSWDSPRVATAVSALKPAQQALVQQRYVDDASLADIAQATATSVSAVHQRLKTVHRALATALAA